MNFGYTEKRQTNKMTPEQTCVDRDRETERQRQRDRETEAGRQTGRQADRQAGRQAGRQTDLQIKESRDRYANNQNRTDIMIYDEGLLMEL